MTETTTSGTFEIEMRPADPLLEGSGRFDFTKTWSGSIVGTGSGVMLSGGDPAGGTAGYVALERFVGSVDGLDGAFLLQQLGRVTDGASELAYQIVPGSGEGALAGITGVVQLDTSDGHAVELTYRLP